MIMTSRRFTSMAFLLLCIIVATVATRPQAQSRTPDVVAIKGATILTGTRGTIQNGTIVLRAGKIAAVGANVAIPPGADVVDGAGLDHHPDLPPRLHRVYLFDARLRLRDLLKSF